MKKNIELKFNQFFILINHKGIKEVFKIIINYFFEQFIAIGYIYKVELSNLKYIPENKDFEFQIMNESDLDIMQKNYKTEFDEKIYFDVLSKLKTPNVGGFIIKSRDNICGYFFLAFGRSESGREEKYFDVKKNGYLFSDYVFQKHRGKKIQHYSIYGRLTILKERKYETATSIIERNNIPSIKSYEKFGFQPYLVKLFFRFGNAIRSKSIIKPYKKL